MSNILNDAKRALELASKASPGEWETRVPNGLDNRSIPNMIWSRLGWVATCQLPKQYSIPDAEFIAAGRELVPLLANAVIELNGDIEYLKSQSQGPWDKGEILKEHNCDLIQKLAIAEEALEYVLNTKEMSGSMEDLCREALQKIKNNK